MAKNYKTQKKKTTTYYVLTTLIKILLFIVVVIFAFIAYKKADFSSNSLDFGNVKQTKTEAAAPSQLKWFDDFKGVENVSGKNSPKKEEKEQGGASSGFKFQGFGK